MELEITTEHLKKYSIFVASLIWSGYFVKLKKVAFDEGIIRNRLKIQSAITNAQLFMEIQQEFGSFSNFIWRFVDGKPKVNCFHQRNEVPATTEISDAISKTLKKRGFKFVGSTVIYAFMQAVGMVNDHTTTCFKFHHSCS